MQELRGGKSGRPKAIKTNKKVQDKKLEGYSQSQTAKLLSLSLPTVKRHWNVKYDTSC